MQQGNDYDLTRPLASAIRATAPYVGIPIPGHAPLTLDRKQLSGALRGVKVLHVELVTAEETPHNVNARARWLRIEGVAGGGRIRTRCTIRATPSTFWRTLEGKDILGKWREAGSRKPPARATGADRKAAATANRAALTLRRLERELEKMGRLYTPCNPATECARYTPADYTREAIVKLRATRRQRTIIGGIAAQARREHWTSAQLYKHLAARGYDFLKMSDMRGSEREHFGAEHFGKYLTNLHRFVLCSGLYQQTFMQHRAYRGRENENRWGAARYRPYLEERRRRQSIEAQIASTREILHEALAAKAS